jgi:hypothetical protein
MPTRTTRRRITPPQLVAGFGLREGTHYHAIVTLLCHNLGTPVSINALAQAAYGDTSKKHKRRVMAMIRRLENKIIPAKQVPLRFAERSYNVQEVTLGATET